MDRPRTPLAPLLGLGLLVAGGAWLLRPPEAGGPPGAEERGERKLRFCLSCHALDGPPEKNPLAPRVRGWTRDQAYENVGQLDRLHPAMILSFEGTEEERRALAAALERLGSGRRP